MGTLVDRNIKLNKIHVYMNLKHSILNINKIQTL